MDGVDVTVVPGADAPALADSGSSSVSVGSAPGTGRTTGGTRGVRPGFTGGRAAARYVRRVSPQAAVRMDVRPLDAIVAMVSAGLGVSVVPRPRAALLASHGVVALPLGRSAPVRELSFVRRTRDTGDRNGDAVLAALHAACAAKA